MASQKILALTQKLNALEDIEKKQRLKSYLPKNTLEELESEFIPDHVIPVNITIEKLAKRIDVSHFLHYFASIDHNTKIFFITAFPKYKQVLLTEENHKYREFANKNFSQIVLLQLFKNCFKNFPPPAILPYHPLIEILSDQGIDLSKLIFFLGLIDISAEVKTIISSQTLKLLQKAFTQEQIDFINSLCKGQSPKPLRKMNLFTYEGDKDSLFELIEQRGVFRFVRAIAAVPISYLFLFTYFLPKKISDIMNKERRKKAPLIKDYNQWEDDCLTTWRYLCTYSQ